MLEKKYELRGAACGLDARNSGKSPKQIRIANYARRARVSCMDPGYPAMRAMRRCHGIGVHVRVVGVLPEYLGVEIDSRGDSWINPEFHDPDFSLRIFPRILNSADAARGAR